VVNPPFGKEAYLIESFRDILLLAPVYIPVIILGLPILPAGHCFLDAVGEIGLELDFRAG
jgi:hypothetical protein